MKQNLPPLAEPASAATGESPESTASAQDMAELFVQFASAERHVLWVTEELPGERVHYVSPAFEAIWGRSAASLYANPKVWIEAIHPDDRPGVEAAFERWVASPGEQGFDIEYRIVRPDGGVRWIHDCGQAPVASGRQRRPPHRHRRRHHGGRKLRATRCAPSASAWRPSRPWRRCAVHVPPQRPTGTSASPTAAKRVEELYRVAGSRADDAGLAFAKIHPDDAAARVASVEVSARDPDALARRVPRV